MRHPVLFKAEDHIYTCNGEKYESVSGLWKPYAAPFDGMSISIKKAFSDLDPSAYKQAKSELGYKSDKLISRIYEISSVSKLDIDLKSKFYRDQWAAKAQSGTDFHEAHENIDRAAGGRINSFTGEWTNMINWPIREGYSNQSYEGDMMDLPDGYIVELLVKDDKYKLAGQADQAWIETIGGVRYIDLDDWKGLAVGTLIPTPDGFKAIESLKLGDSVYNGSGDITRIRNVSNIHHNPCYKIKFDTNDEIVADHEHKWVVSESKKRMVKGVVVYFRVESEMTTEEIFHSKKKLAITCSGIKGVEKDLPVDPYVLGMWLADGNSHVPRITSLGGPVWDEIRKRGYELGQNVDNTDSLAESRTILGQTSKFRELGVLKNKHIPEIYFQASYEQRLDLLRGYMDGDGYFHRKRKRCYMESTSYQQTVDVSTLASSLGMKPTILPYKAKGFGKENIPAWYVGFSPSVNPFLTRNQDYHEVVDKTAHVYSNVRYIRSIERVETVPTICLAVEGSDKTYLFSKNYIKTHNTDRQIDVKPSYFERGVGYRKLYYPFDHLYDTNHWKYALKISTYAKMMERKGFVVRNLAFTHVTHDEDNNILTQKRYAIPYKSYEVGLALAEREKSLKKVV